MPISYVKKSDAAQAALARAFNSLKEQEQLLIVEVSTSQKQLEQIRAAISSIRPLLEGEIEEQSKQEPLGFVEHGAKSPFEGLAFSEALRVYMRGIINPLTVREITDGMIGSGFKFNSASPATQVAVGLKRGEGRFFERYDNRWCYKRSAPDAVQMLEELKNS